MRLLIRFMGYTRTHGLGFATNKALHLTWSLFRAALQSVLPARGRYVIVSHQLDASGAPHIVLGVVEDFAGHVGASAVRLITFEPVAQEHIDRLRNQSIQVDVYPHGLSSLVRLNSRDKVVMNSTAIPAAFVYYAFGLAERGRLAALHWYVHEDEPERLFPAPLEEQMRKLLGQQRLRIWVGGKKACANYHRYFGALPHIRYLPYRLEVDEVFCAPKQPAEFEMLRFHVTATIRDCGKGQFGVLLAFQELLSRGRSAGYRPFELHFNGIEEESVSARHLVECGQAVLGSRFKHGGRTNLRSETLARMKACQVVICYSVRECLPLVVMEGMAMGQVVLRNACSGIDEQLEEGVNGFYVESGNPRQFADVLERILDPRQTSNAALCQMGRRSQEMARGFMELEYFNRMMGPDQQ